MTKNEMIIVIVTILIAVFIFGWVARWLFGRLNAFSPLASDEAMARMVEAEEALENREREFSATEAQYANAYSQLEAELEASMSGLGEARRELREIKSLAE